MKSKITKDTKVVENKEKSKVYRLEEMIEAIDQSVANAEQVMKQQSELIEIVKDSNKSGFDEFIKDETESVNNLSKQIEILKYRKTLLEYIVEKSRQSKEIEDVANAMISAFGLFENK